MAIDYTTSVGKVRLLIKDTNEASPIFSDAQLQAFVDLEGGSVWAAAASALRALASDKGRLPGSFSILASNLSVSQGNVPGVLMQLADAYDKKAEQNDEGDYFVDWHLHIHPSDGRDETDYDADEDETEKRYHDVHYWNDKE